MEQLFTNLDPTSAETESADIDVILRRRMEDALDYNETHLAPIRMRAEMLYRGALPEKDGEGRSSIVSMEVRDVIMGMVPSLIRVFSSDEHPVTFVPNYETNFVGMDATELSRLQTDFCSHIFWADNDGFNIIYNTVMNSLRKGMAVAYWETEDDVKTTVKDFNNITSEQLDRLIAEHGDSVLDVVDFVDNETGMPSYDCKVETRKVHPRFKIYSVKPEEFRIARDAECVETASLVGWDTLKTVSYLVERGYNLEDIKDVAGGGSSSTLASDEERTIRNPALDIGEVSSFDLSGTKVRFGRYFVHYDSDGDGIDELHFIETIGDSYEIFHDEIVDRKRFALTSYDPEPHTAVGHSVAENMEDLQLIKTNILRNTLDALASSVNPTTVINEVVTNVSDALNDEVGKVIRTRGDVRAAVGHVVTPFMGDQSMAMVNYLDVQKQNRTGITDASKGLDPKALQSTSTAGVNMVIAGAQERTELVARIVAYQFFCPLFLGLLHEISNTNPINRTVEIRGQPVQIDTTMFDPTLGIRVNPALSRGSASERIVVLNNVLQAQTMIIQEHGPDNPLVTPIEYRNTWEDILSISNVRNVSRYFRKVTPEELDNISKQKAAQAAANPDPSVIIARNEQEKVRAKTVEHISNDQFRRDKLEKDDEFRKKKLEADVGAKLADIFGKYGITPNDDEIKRFMDIVEREIEGDKQHGRQIEIGQLEHERRTDQEARRASLPDASGRSSSGSSV